MTTSCPLAERCSAVGQPTNPSPPRTPIRIPPLRVERPPTTTQPQHDPKSPSRQRHDSRALGARRAQSGGCETAWALVVGPEVKGGGGVSTKAASSNDDTRRRTERAAEPGAEAGRGPEATPPEPDFTAELLALNERAAKVLGGGVMTRMEELIGTSFSLINPEAVQRAFRAFQLDLMTDPRRMAEAQAALWRDSFALWHKVIEGQRKGHFEPVVTPPPSDRRFKDKAWHEEPGFAYLQQTYLLLANWLTQMVEQASDLDPATRRRLKFFTRQYVSAMSPSNFPLTNPEVLRRAEATQGRSLLHGLENFLADLERGDGHLQINMTDADAFGLGKNLALSPGKVIFKNDLIELIQYSPSTDVVHERPLLIVPAWINKFYILDLQPRNSFVKYAVAQGFTVFLMSWRNPNKQLAHKRFEDYLTDGPLAALDAIEQHIGVREVSLLNYCIGGILASVGLARMAALGDDRIKSSTFLVTMFDFTDPGEIGVFVDAENLDAMEEHTQATGFLESRHMATMFQLLRENDLIWSFFVNNYLLGKDPQPFDLLYWNADATRLPATMLSDYVRAFYLGNALARPNTFEVLGTKIDTRLIETPAYALATVEDHIAPWRSCYPVTQQFKGPVRFVLAGSGHIAGVMNPPAGRPKYGYWTNDDRSQADPDAWLQAAEHNEGSWWPDWSAWLASHSGPMVAARDPAKGKLAILGDAPGEYVKERPDDGPNAS
ncbi:MAG: class I poly(R)-hydroxyalkanoic acid synthase [Geminicoccaceae bacterium]|nr:MAG: class I poly(R)-hydroxyalkanoic acid synthase [Geminicoccaceae bacterium]